MYRKYQFYYKAGTPTSVEGIVHFKVEESLSDLTIVDANLTLQKPTVGELFGHLSFRFHRQTEIVLKANSDTIGQIVDYVAMTEEWQVKSLSMYTPNQSNAQALPCKVCHGLGQIPPVDSELWGHGWTNCGLCGGTGLG